MALARGAQVPPVCSLHTNHISEPETDEVFVWNLTDLTETLMLLYWSLLNSLTGAGGGLSHCCRGLAWRLWTCWSLFGHRSLGWIGAFGNLDKQS